MIIIKKIVTNFSTILKLNKLNTNENNFIREQVRENEVVKYFEKYVKNIEISSEVQVSNCNEVVWQLWFQGIENAPPIIKTCFDSVDCFAAKKKIIRLSEKNIENYISIPGYIYDKKKQGCISNASFSDILRVFLLAEHGGTWLDSTIYLTASIDNIIKKNRLFLFSTTPEELRGRRNIIASSWFIHSNQENLIFKKLKQVLMTFWATENQCHHYYYFHLLFTLIIQHHRDCKEEWENVPFFSNVPPHILQKELFYKFSEQRFNEIKLMSNIHKLTYYGGREFNTNLPNTFYKYIIDNIT